jgi:hypothetical protein
MKTKKEIVDNWLPRYTGAALSDLGQHILLTNFGHYLELFAGAAGVPIVGRERPMPHATADGITMINFGMGSANAATVMDLLSAISPKAVLLLGKCGGRPVGTQLRDAGVHGRKIGHGPRKRRGALTSRSAPLDQKAAARPLRESAWPQNSAVTVMPKVRRSPKNGAYCMVRAPPVPTSASELVAYSSSNRFLAHSCTP